VVIRLSSGRKVWIAPLEDDSRRGSVEASYLGVTVNYLRPPHASVANSTRPRVLLSCRPRLTRKVATMAKRVLISGGAGFVPSHLCDRFLLDGWDVLAVDNFCTGRQSNIAHLQGNPHFDLLEQDVSTPFQVAGPLDAVLHFASPASPVDYLRLPIETLQVGSLGTMNLLEIAREKKARFLMASTSEIYGDPLEHPQRESYLGNVSSIGPRSVYDEAKRFSEAAVMGWRNARGVDTRIIRIFNTYGPRMKSGDGRVVSNFIVQALRGEKLTVYGDGQQTRSFCYVSDLVDGIVRVLERGDHMPYNLGNPGEFTMLELVQEIGKLTGDLDVDYLPLPKDDPTRRKPDITRATTELGWMPKVPLHEGLVAMIADLRQRLAAGDA
jgi:dTDP-glucose 4,6-dehydratase